LRKVYSREWYIVPLIHLPRLSAVVTEDEYKRVVRFVRAGAAKSTAELVRLAVTEYTMKAGIAKLVNLRVVSMSEARRAVERYLKKQAGAVWPDEMAEELGIDYRIVLAVVRELLAEGNVEETSRSVEEVLA
jgi:mRNA-degrading endonuclease toxin of MazEF toxin-antitoxin module